MLIDLPNTSETLTDLATCLPSGHSRHLIADGVRGTAQTIAMMQKLVASAKRDNDVRRVVGSILNPSNGQAPCKPKDYFNYARLLYEWVRDNILYAYDPHMVEFLESPKKLLQNKIGDCDSQDMLLCAMFEQIGLQSQFVTIKADSNRPDEYTHVYTRVMIPKLGWVVADPIMPEKWFGWEPPYPSGRRYWPASADEANDDVDTSDSIPFPSPNSQGPSQMDFSDVVGMGKLKAKQPPVAWGTVKARKNMMGLGCGCNSLSMNMPVPDQIIVVETTEICSQEIESPMNDGNFGLRGLNGILDVLGNPLQSAVAAVSTLVGSKAPISDDTTKWWITRIADGTEAANLNAARAKANAGSDAAAKALTAARAMSDANPNKSAALSAASALRDAANNLQYSINDAMGKYNEVAALISGLTHDAYSIPRLSGLGFTFPTAALTVIISSVAISWAVYAYSQAWADTTSKTTAVELAKLEFAKANPQQASLVFGQKTQSSQTDSGSWSDFYNKSSGKLVESAVTLGGVFLVGYIAYKLVGYSANVADSKIRQTLKLT